jgi:hypothetical protein
MPFVFNRRYATGGCCVADSRGLKSTATLVRRYATLIRASSPHPKTLPPHRPSKAPLRSPRPWRENGCSDRRLRSFCAPCVNGSEDSVAARLPCVLCCEKSGSSTPWKKFSTPWKFRIFHGNAPGADSCPVWPTAYPAADCAFGPSRATCCAGWRPPGGRPPRCVPPRPASYRR